MQRLAQFWYHPKIRAGFYQIILLALVLVTVWFLFSNLMANLEKQGIAAGFDFLRSTAGFSIISTLIPYAETSTYGRALLVGLLNTLLVAVLGNILATFLGFGLGVCRLSKNWLVAKLAGVIVELMRNVPLLLIIFFIYFGVLRLLPAPRASLAFFDVIFLNNRGLYIPWLEAVEAAASPAVSTYHWSLPVLSGFDFQGGLVVTPELLALLLALSIYTAGFIAELVRAGILAVSYGQREAAFSLGLTRWQSLRFVVMPQAMRAIIPPLTSQLLNLTKNSSLATAIGYPDLVQVFAGTVLSQTGQAVEIISLTMFVYLIVSLCISLLMNAYNRRTLLMERGTMS